MSQEFIVKVRITLAKYNKTAAWLANAIGISRSYMSDIMNGKRKPDRQIGPITKVLEELEKSEVE